MRTWRRSLLLLLLGAATAGLTAAPAAPREITDFLPVLQANPTWESNAARTGAMVRYAKFPDWVAARIAFQEWIARDPVAPWVSLWQCRSRVPEADWQLLQRELLFMARFHATPQYKLLVDGWEGSMSGFPKDNKAWQKQIDRLPRKAGILTLIASEKLLDDWPTTANFILVQQVEAPRKAELVDVALKSWASRTGFDEPLAWLQGTGATGEIWNLPIAWMAVDLFPTKPDVAAQLLARVDDPVIKQVAIHAIATGAAKPESLEPIRALIDAPTWKLITTR